MARPATTAVPIDSRAPNSSRDRMSRPRLSVPSRNSPDGGRYFLATSTPLGSCGAISGASRAAAARATTRITPSIAVRSRRSTRQMWLARPELGRQRPVAPSGVVWVPVMVTVIGRPPGGCGGR